LGAALVFAAAFIHWIAVEAHETNDAIIKEGSSIFFSISALSDVL
jgi:hypothetical protein